MIIKVKKIHANACLPVKSNREDAGFDIFSVEGRRIEPGQRASVSTGISMEIPSGYYGQILPRSGLALKSGIQIMGGVIDSGYRGEIKVILYNSEPYFYTVNSGDRIAQMVILPVPEIELVEAEELSDTVRSDAGFGSTGK